jgi:hypothetical protein
MKTNKLSFKKEPKSTGLARVANPHSSTKILINKEWCGTIQHPFKYSKNDLWTVGLMIIKADIMEDDNPNCPWRWAWMKTQFKDDVEAKAWIKENWEMLLMRYDIRKTKD